MRFVFYLKSIYTPLSLTIIFRFFICPIYTAQIRRITRIEVNLLWHFEHNIWFIVSNTLNHTHKIFRNIFFFTIFKVHVIWRTLNIRLCYTFHRELRFMNLRFHARAKCQLLTFMKKKKGKHETIMWKILKNRKFSDFCLSSCIMWGNGSTIYT